MAVYVIVGLHKERCRAKNPKTCRHHVGSDGKPLRHYTDAWNADKALAKLERQAESQPSTVKSITPDDGADILDYSAMEVMNGDEVIDDESLWDDNQHSGSQGGKDADDLILTGKRKTRVQKAAETQWDDATSITPSTMQSLNRLRADASRRKASSMAASNLIMLAMRELATKGYMAMDLMWGEEEGTASWPEWWSTREAERLTTEQITDTAMIQCPSWNENAHPITRVYTDPSSSVVTWTHDVLDEHEQYDCEELSWESGVYDAVRDGALTWDDLRSIGAISCLLTAWTVIQRSPSSSVAQAKTVNVWCGRKPRNEVYTAGDVDEHPDKAFKNLEDMMVSFERMCAGMTQALVTFTIVGQSVNQIDTHNDIMGS